MPALLRKVKISLCPLRLCGESLAQLLHHRPQTHRQLAHRTQPRSRDRMIKVQFTRRLRKPYTIFPAKARLPGI